jgi:hypothetical protein
MLHYVCFKSGVMVGVLVLVCVCVCVPYGVGKLEV